jgi:hypothetical protein
VSGAWDRPGQLRRNGVPEELRDAYQAEVNGLANLQLLHGPVNIGKKDSWPWDWLVSGAFASPAAREQHVVQNDLDLMPDSFDGFLTFTAARRERLEQRLRTLLNVGEGVISLE